MAPVQSVFDAAPDATTMPAMTGSSLLSGWASRLAAVSAGVGLLLGVAGCHSTGEGEPRRRPFHGADVKIKGAGVLEVRQAVVDVMTENQFRLTTPIGNVMTFEKEGTRNDEWMYGSYGSRPMRQRCTITLTIGDDPETIELVASGEVVREYSNMTGEEIGWLPAGGALRYGKYLDMIKKHVRYRLTGGGARESAPDDSADAAPELAPADMF